MAKKIYPGNQVTRLRSYNSLPGNNALNPVGVVALPGRIYYNIVGYAQVTATGGTVFPIIIPSPDRRGDDKPRPDITGRGFYFLISRPNGIPPTRLPSW